MGGARSYETEKKKDFFFFFFFFFFAKKARSNRLVVFFFFFIIIFVVLMQNRISSEYVPRVKVLVFADLIYYRIVIVESMQVIYISITL